MLKVIVATSLLVLAPIAMVEEGDKADFAANTVEAFVELLSTMVA